MCGQPRWHWVRDQEGTWELGALRMGSATLPRKIVLFHFRALEVQRCAQEHLYDCWLMTRARAMAGCLVRTHHCQGGNHTPSRVTKELPGWWARGLGHPIMASPAAGSAVGKRSGRSLPHLSRAPALGNTWSGSDARDRGVGASSFGRGKSRGTQTSDYLHPELLSGGSL